MTYYYEKFRPCIKRLATILGQLRIAHLKYPSHALCQLTNTIARAVIQQTAQ